MLISLNEIKKLVNIPSNVSTDELVKLIGSRLVEVEGTIDRSERYNNIYIAKVVSAEEIEGTHLHLCKINAGEAGKPFAEDYIKNHPNEILTNDESLVQVVCGAPNVHAGMLAVWIAPGAIVPSTFDDEKFEIGMRPLRGYDSYGMLAGADELGFDTEHKFIAEIDPKKKVALGTGTAGEGSMRPVAPGDALSDVFDLNDVILDIENKSLTHRPDTFGLIGFAREVAGILGIKFDNEKNYYENNISERLNELEKTSNDFSIKIADSSICECYSAAIFETDDALETEKYLTDDAVFLAKAGMRSISKIVDATNIIMLKTGQPLHAFDYDKFVEVGGSKSVEIGVRLAKDGEKLKLLDGSTIELIPDDIVITSSDIPVALAGAMGGESTEIDSSTKRVILESATFSLYNERKTQMAHGIFSEAITRFTKGQPAAATSLALAKCIELLVPAEKVSSYEISRLNSGAEEPIKLNLSDINSLLGSDFTAGKVKTTLENVGFIVKEKDGKFEVKSPAWRTDIHIKEDIIEEVGRLNGYDNITPTLPFREFISAERNVLFDLKREIRSALSDRLNANEVLTYSFVSKALQEKVGENVEDSYEIVNSISPELQVFRQSIVPSLLEKVHDNLKAGFSDFTLYEMNQISRKSFGLESVLTPDLKEIAKMGDKNWSDTVSSWQSEGTPVIKNHLALVTTGDFYAAKSYLLALAKTLRIKLDFNYEAKSDFSFIEPTRHAEILAIKEDGSAVKVGSLGEIKRNVARSFKLEDTVSCFEIDLDVLSENASRNDKINFSFSRFPSTSRDVTISTSKSYHEIEQEIKEKLTAISDLVFLVEPVSVYRPENAENLNLSFRLTFASTKKTLQSAEISDIMEKIESIK